MKEAMLFCDSNTCRNAAGKNYSTGGPIHKETILESYFRAGVHKCKDCNSILFKKAYRYAAHSRRHTKIKETKLY